MRLKQERGFTLVELLVAVAILVLLCTFAVHKVYAAVSTSKGGRIQKDLETIQQALEKHYLDLGYYPKKLNDLIDRGYLQQQTFKVPGLKDKYYFYAVDDNRSKYQPKAYILGAPTKESNQDYQLRHQGPLPWGLPPTQRGRAWKYTDGGTSASPYLTLFKDDADQFPVTFTDPVPDQLGTYRLACRSGSSTRCDLWAN